MFGLQQGQMGMSAPGFGGGYGASPYGGGGGFGGFGGGSMGGVMGGSDPSSIDSQMMALGQQNQMQGAMYLQMFNLMGMVMQMTMMKQMMSSMANFGGGGSGGGGGDAGIGNFLGGGSGGGGGAAPASGASAAGDAGGASGSSAVDIAKKYMGRKSGEINDMANFTHAGGMTNNCADFVSACLANAGVYKKKPGDASVRVLKGHLIEDGWKKVSKAQAKPGDVAIFNGTQHIELVATQGATQLIGSNNKGNASTQTVSTDSGNWGSVEYYTK